MIQYTTAWNPFVQELQAILHEHNKNLNYLDNPIGIHREKVRRLQQSLSTPTQLPVLNPEDLQTVIDTLQLDTIEILRLHTALLATAIQRMLSNRVHPDDAQLAAQQLQPTILSALIRYTNENGLGNTRGGDLDPIDDDDFDRIFSAITNTFDRGEEALNMSYYTTSYEEQLRTAQYADTCFKNAQKGLQQMSGDIRLLSGWQTLNDSVQEALTGVNNRLRELGE